LAVGGGVYDHHLGPRHFGAGANGRPAVLDGAPYLQEDIAAPRLGCCVGDVQLVAEIGLGGKALLAYGWRRGECDGAWEISLQVKDGDNWGAPSPATTPRIEKCMVNV
jgi:hypothetical protein